MHGADGWSRVGSRPGSVLAPASRIGEVGGGSLFSLGVASVKISKRNVKGCSKVAFFIGSTLVKSRVHTHTAGLGGRCKCTHIRGVVAPSPCHMRPRYPLRHHYNNYRVRTLSCRRRLTFGRGGIHDGLREVKKFSGRRLRRMYLPVIKVRRPFHCHGGTRFPIKLSGRKGLIAKFCTTHARTVVPIRSYLLKMRRGGSILVTMGR